MYTKQDIKNQLTALGVRAEGITLVHTSLRSVGALEAGGVTLLDALVEYFTEGGGLLCIPTHSLIQAYILSASADSCYFFFRETSEQRLHHSVQGNILKRIVQYPKKL